LSSAQQAPDGMSAERLAISRAFGAQVMTVGDFTSTTRWPRWPSAAASRDTSRRSPLRVFAADIGGQLDGLRPSA
jgi:hypothetical protein